MEEWSSEGDNGADCSNQHGCVNCDNDPKGPWCISQNPDVTCRTTEDGTWRYCDGNTS
eukprot:UN06619